MKLLKRIGKIILALLILIALTFIIIINQSDFGQLPKGERKQRVEQSPNYKDGEFQNLSETSVMTSDKSTLGAMMDFMFAEKINVVPDTLLPAIVTNLKTIPKEQDVLVWFGHSSYFVQLHGVRFLIDPVFSGYAGPFSFVNKAFEGTDVYKSDAMPSIDYLIITHDHWDHLDYTTVLELEHKVKHVVCGLGVGQDFEYWGYNPSKIIELDWYEGFTLANGMQLTATPARHYSGRGVTRNQTLWASYALQSDDYKLYIGGDSGYDAFYKKIGDIYGPFDITVLEQGQYSKNWNQIHLLPSEVMQAGKDLKATSILPVHNSKFALAAHPWNEPLNLIVEKQELPVATPEIGEIVYLRDTTQTFQQWWKKQ